jgi:hypothetical protein
MKIALITANLNQIDQDNFQDSVGQILPQDWIATVFKFNDSNFSPRKNALHPRLQAKIPKILGFEYAPDFDYYIWLDGSFRISSPYSLQWLIESLGDKEIALFPHPERNSITEELEFMECEISRGNGYLLSRYENEPMREQINHYINDPTFVDDRLYAAGVIVYNTNKVPRTSQMLQFWFYQCARWSVQDQLSLPFALKKHGIDPAALQGNIFKSEFLEFKVHNK